MLTCKFSQRLLIVAALLVAGLVGASTPHLPSLLLLAIAAGCTVFVLLLMDGYNTERLFLLSLSILLAGYALQGRGFAYLGLPPLYIGEMVLALGLVAVVGGRARWRFSPIHGLILAFVTLGLIRTIPFIGEYGIYAVRDASLWYYAAFAMLVSMVLTRTHLLRTARLVAQVLPFAIAWMAFMSIFLRLLPESFPHFPGSPLPILSLMKAGDRAVVLSSMAAFVLVGLNSRLAPNRRFPQPAFWFLWLVCAFLVAIQNRGGILTLIVSLGVVGLVSPSRRWIQMAAVAIFVLGSLLIVNPQYQSGGRQISINQFTTNLVSIFSDDTQNAGRVQGTKDWRLSLWSEIYDDTVNGPYFWEGRGFGINLVTAYDHEIGRDGEVRAPHNTHVSVLGRMGVPGALIWATLHIAFLREMLRAYRHARRFGDDLQSNITLWLLATWLAAMVNTSFDAYLEGPQGAIPFWCVFGAGLVAIRIQQGSQAHSQYDAVVRSGGFNAHTAGA